MGRLLACHLQAFVLPVHYADLEKIALNLSKSVTRLKHLDTITWQAKNYLVNCAGVCCDERIERSRGVCGELSVHSD